MVLSDTFETMRGNRKMLLFIVYVAIFLDNMLLTVVVPIMPEFLYRLEHPNTSIYALTVTRIPCPPKATRAFTVNPCTTVTNAVSVKKYRKRPIKSKRRAQMEAVEYGDGYDEYDNDYGEGVAATTARVSYRSTRGRASSTRGYGLSARGDRNRSRNRNRTEFSTSTGDPCADSMGLTEISLEADNCAENDQPMNATLEEEKRRDFLTKENINVGIMFGSKALIQLITNPFVGPLTNRIGYTVPMFTGFVIMFISTLIFAFGESYAVLFIARTLQGIGSACTSSSGMGMLAHAYPDDEERGAAMGIALGGLALGVLVGPPFGGVLYQYSGKELPFVILAFLALFDGALQLLVLRPKIVTGVQEGTSLKELIKDPYINVAAGAITIGNLGIAMLEPSLPLWMMRTMGASSATRGAAFLPASISYMIGANIFGPLAHKIGRWLATLIGLLVIGLCLIAIPTADSVYGLVLPNGFMGFAIGMIDSSMFPHMGYLVDLRHVGVYGSIYAIADAAFCFAFALGPFLSGPMVRGLGFPEMLYIIAVINFLYAPLMLFLRNPPARAPEKQNLISSSSSVGYYQQFNNNFGNETEIIRQPRESGDFIDYGY